MTDWARNLEGKKIERAIKKKYPGWYHTCFRNKENCSACKLLTLIKSSIK